MNINRPVIVTPDIESRFQNFIVFEPSSSRISDIDVLVQGEEVVHMYQTLVNSLAHDSSIQAQILLNKTSKIGQMLDLLSSYDNVIVTKFFDRVWRRYSYVSNIGEPFLNLSNYLDVFAENRKFDQDAIVAQRIDGDDDDPTEDDSTDDVDGDNTDSESDSDEKSEEKAD